MFYKKIKKSTAIFLAVIMAIIPISLVMPQKAVAATYSTVSVTTQNLSYGGSPYVSNAWGVSDSPYTLVENAYTVDPDTKAVSITWVAPANGIVNLNNNQSYAQLQNSGGNGVRLRVVKEDQLIFPTNSSWQTITTTTLVLITAPGFSVSAGDKINFIIDNNGNSASDTTTLVAKVNFTPTGGTSSLYDSTTSYSTTTQGTNGFYYQWAIFNDELNSILVSQNLTYGGSPNVSNAWGVADSPYTLVENAYTVDPDTKAVSITWVAPSKGLVNLNNNQSYAQLQNSGGNGIRLKVVKENQVIFPSTGSWQTITNTSLVLIAVPGFFVNAGDKISFIIDNNGNSSLDATTLVAKVNFTPTGGSSTLYDSTTSYSTTAQGTNGFYYQWVTFEAPSSLKVTSQNLTYGGSPSVPNAWGVSDSPYTLVENSYTVDPDTKSVSLTWVAPGNGTVNLNNNLSYAQLQNSGGNGIRVRVIRENQVVFPSDGSWQTVTTTSLTLIAAAGFVVNAGDKLYFIVENNGSSTLDTTTLVAKFYFTPIGGSSTLYDSSTSYSITTQGTNGFYYQWVTVDDGKTSLVVTKNLTYGGSPNATNAWGTAESPYTLVENSTAVDPDSKAISITWIAPTRGLVNLNNNQSYAKLQNTSGNGVRLRVVRGNQVVFPANGSWQTITTTSLVLITAAGFFVDAGDKMSFIIDNNGDSASDTTTLVAKINFTPVGGSSILYDSSTSYSTTTQGTNGFYYQSAVIQDSVSLYSVDGMWSWYGEGSIFSQFTNYCNVIKKKGFNSVTFDISLDRVESTQNIYDFSYYDSFFDYAVSVGLKMYMRVSCRMLPSWVPTSWLMRDQNGALLNIQDNTGGSRILNLLSFSNSDARNAIAAYYKAVVTHYQSRYSAYKNPPIIEYMTMFDPTAEFEYSINAQTDYCDSAKVAFRTWLTNTYGSVAVLNNMWGTSHASFSAIDPPLLTDQTKMARYSDFLKYRRDMQITFTQQLQTAVYNASSSAKFGIVFGSVYDNNIIRRGTLFADYLIPYCDAVHVADAPDYYFAYSMDLLRGISMGKPFSNEIDNPNINGASNTAYQNQWSTTLSRGANSIFVANWYSSEFLNSTTYPFIDNLATYVKSNGVTSVAPTTAMYTSTAMLEKNGSFVTTSQARYNSITNNGANAIDIIRDASFVNNPSYLNRYSTIYFDSNSVISDEARVALLAYVAQGGQISYDGNNYGTLDEYNNARDPLNNISDSNAPTLLLDTTKNGSNVQGSSYVLHGISKDTGGAGVKTVQYSINGGSYVNATGLTQFSINITGSPATYSVTVRAIDNSNNTSTTAIFSVTLTA